MFFRHRRPYAVSAFLKTMLAAALAAAPALALASCAQVTSSGSTSAAVAVDFSNTSSYSIDFTADTITLTASGLTGKTLILAKLNTSDTKVASANTGSATLDSPTSSSSSRALRSAKADASLPPPRRPHPMASSGASAGAASSSRSASSRSASSSAAAVSYGESSSSYVAGTTTATFWVDYYNANGSLAGFDTISATLAKVTDHAYIWVAASGSTTNSEATGGFDPSTSLASSRVELLGDAFEAVVFPEDTAIFGYERGGGTGGDGGIDGDQHISILVYDIDFDYSSSASSGYVAGYFWSKDDATAAATDTYSSSAVYPSNGKEIFYLDAWALQNYPYTIVSTLAHEYQHMINYNRETYQGRTAASTWLDEFRSLAAEDLLAPAFAEFSSANTYSGVDAYSFKTDGPGFWAYYYDNYSNTYPYFGLNVWSSSLYDYAFASMFASYLLRAYGGVQFLSDEIAQADAGASASEGFIYAAQAAASRSAYTDGTAPASGALTSFSSDFYAEILSPYAYALWGAGADGAAGKTPYTRTDAKAASATASGTRYLNAFTVLDSSDSNTIWPHCYTISSSVALPAHSFTYHTDSALTAMEQDTATITIAKPANSNVKYRLIVVE